MNINQRIRYQSPGLTPQSTPALQQAINTAADKKGSELVIKDKAGKSQILSLDPKDPLSISRATQALQKAGVQKGVLSLELANGESLMIELKNLTRESLLAALAKAPNSLAPSLRQGFVDSAKSIIDGMRSTTTLKKPTYKSRPYDPTVIKAQKWKAGGVNTQNGVDANRTINETYHHLDKQFTTYLGGSPPVPNWMSFGKYASREAGSQIRNLEAGLEAIETLFGFDGSPSNDAAALEGLYDLASQDRMIEQAIRMAAKTAGYSNADDMTIKKILATAATDPKGFYTAMKKTLTHLHDALVKGNTRIYENIAPAYDIFLKAESQGKDGLQALRDAGYDGGGKGKVFADGTKVRDPQGFVLKAFSKYKEARLLLEQAQNAGPKDKEALLAQRQQLIHEANLLIGFQEQLSILQSPEIFGDPVVKGLLEAMGGTMSLIDENGKHALLPNGKPGQTGWADFKTRMGLKEVPVGTPGAIQAKMPDGSTKAFVPRPTKEVPGTISEYFTTTTFNPTMAKKVIQGKPRSIEALHVSNPQVNQLHRIFSENANDPIKLNKALHDYYDSAVSVGIVNNEYDNTVYQFATTLSDANLAKLDDRLLLKMIKALDSGSTDDKEYALIRKLASFASTQGKADIINYFLNQTKVTQGQEDAVYYILKDTPYENREFLNLMDKIDVKDLAYELETDKDVAQIGVWLATAYAKEGTSPSGQALTDLLQQAAQDNRNGILDSFANHKDIQANGRALFKTIPSSTIKSLADTLMKGYTSGPDQKTIYNLIKNTGWKQFANMMDAPFRDRLKNMLTTDQYQQIEKWFHEIPQHIGK